MKNLLKKFSLIGLLSLFLMGFLNVGVAETTDIFSGQSLLVAEADAAPVVKESYSKHRMLLPLYDL